MLGDINFSVCDNLCASNITIQLNIDYELVATMYMYICIIITIRSCCVLQVLARNTEEVGTSISMRL